MGVRPLSSPLFSLLGPKGTPVAGATVTVTGTATTTASDAAGNFVLEQPAGTWSLTVAADGFETFETASFTVLAGDEDDAGTIVLTPLVSDVSGTVVDSVSLVPLAGASVTVTGPAITTTTDVDGSFTVTVEGGSWTLTIAHDEYATLTTAPVHRRSRRGSRRSGLSLS